MGIWRAGGRSECVRLRLDVYVCVSGGWWVWASDSTVCVWHSGQGEERGCHGDVNT